MAHIYDDLLSDVPWARPPQEAKGTRHTYQTYAVYLDVGNRDQVITKLAAQGIETQIGTYALHLLPQYRTVRRIGGLENAERLYQHLLALPMAYDLTDDDQTRVVDELKHVVA